MKAFKVFHERAGNLQPAIIYVDWSYEIGKLITRFPHHGPFTAFSKLDHAKCFRNDYSIYGNFEIWVIEGKKSKYRQVWTLKFSKNSGFPKGTIFFDSFRILDRILPFDSSSK